MTSDLPHPKPIDEAPHVFGEPIDVMLPSGSRTRVEWNEAWGYEGWFLCDEVCKPVKPIYWFPSNK